MNEDKLKALHLIFNDSPIYAIDDSPSTPITKNSDSKIGFISKYKAVSEIPETELTFLRKIFTAAKIDESSISFTNSLDNHTFETVIGMGVNPFELGIQDTTFPFYEVKKYNSKNFIFTDDITSIMADKSKKEGLWFGLKRMFGV